MRLTLAALLFLLGGILAVIAIFVSPPRFNLWSAALACVSFGLLCMTSGLGQ